LEGTYGKEEGYKNMFIFSSLTMTQI